MRIVIVNPTYNEKENIRILTERINKIRPKIAKHGDELLQLVVDDHSPDRTAAIVKQMQKDNPDIHLIQGKKQGLGEAYKRGFRHAMTKMDADIIVMMDADLQHEPEALPAMLRLLGRKYDFIIGSRYIRNGTYPDTWSKFRVLNSKIANILAIRIAGIKDIADCTSGYRLIRVKGYLDKVDLNQVKAIGYSFQLMLLYALLFQGAKVKEYPIHFQERNAGKSKISFNTTYIRDIAEFFRNAFAIRFAKLHFLLKR